MKVYQHTAKLLGIVCLHSSSTITYNSNLEGSSLKLMDSIIPRN